MKIIIPMAGMGKRMRPHTLTTPKPLIKIAGKTIVNHLLGEIKGVVDEKVDEVNFVIGDFGQQIENELKQLAINLGAKGVISYQEKPLGTAHAVYCARESLEGNVIVAFSDTLFKADFRLNTLNDGIIWTKKVDNPGSFGVVQKNGKGFVEGFFEKPDKFISDEAIIGVYYFKEGNELQSEIKHLLDNHITGNGEYQLTDALENLRRKGKLFTTSIVGEWYDCGNKAATVETNRKILKHYDPEHLVSKSAKLENSVIVVPCYIGDNVVIENSVIGPYVSVENNTNINNSLIRNSIIQSDSRLEYVNISNSMIGSSINMEGKPSDLSIGDYTNIKV